MAKLTYRWDGNSAAGWCSEQVKIIFSAIYNTVNELGVKAYAWQGRNITPHIIEIVRSIFCFLSNYMLSVSEINCVFLAAVAGFAQIYDERGRVAAEQVISNIG